MEQKIKLRTLTVEEGASLFKMQATRARLDSEMVLLAQLVEESRVELARLNRSLEDKYGIQPRQMYSYDPPTRTLFLNPETEEPAEGTNGVAKTASIQARSVLRVFSDDAEAKRFLQMAGVRARNAAAVESLTWLLREKQDQYKAGGQGLKDGFGIEPDKRYFYDRDSRTIYLLEKIASN